MLLSFERPASAGRLARLRPRRLPGGRNRLSADLENCTVANETGITGRSRKASPVGISSEIPRESRQGFPDHRQDSKGTRWMPWHLESMKGVNGCDKPR
jgi:hypothetical protein